MKKKNFFSILDVIDQIPLNSKEKQWIIADDIDNPKIIKVVNEKDMGLTRGKNRKTATDA